MIASSPAAALAQGTDGLPSDPERDSPAGTVYEIPLDIAREDAAPRGGAGPSGSSSAPTPPPAGDSPIRSENNFGSSSRVPGLDERAAASGHRPATRGERRARDSDAGGTAFDALATTSASADGSGPSPALAILLLALIALVGVGGGTAAARATHAARGA